jgi:hypothetical protein
MTNLYRRNKPSHVPVPGFLSAPPPLRNTANVREGQVAIRTMN